MDPLVSYNEEMRLKTKLVDFFCCDKQNVLEEAKKINNNSFHVCEGYDEEVDRPAQIDKEYNISFIGNLYGPRKQTLSQINHEVKIINNAFGHKHSEEVSRTKINLNFCTDGGASDRVYKVLAAGGFLISNDWDGRSDMFEENKDLVIFTDIKDLNDKINYYLNNPGKREEIAKHGNRTVQKYNRFSWAQQIINIHERLYR
jgi:spore maturation protein CgeB